MSTTDTTKSPDAKRIRLNMKIGTHNGTFHCDEVLAVWMLKRTLQFRDAEIVRTRDPAILAECDIVVDVGAVFDHSKLRYDHHQREFKETYNSLDSTKPWKTKLSSAGLIYVHYRDEVIKSVMTEAAKSNGLKSSDISSEEVEMISDKVYENFVEEIDAVDNGIAVAEETPKYKITTTLSNRVGNLNPRWNEDSNDNILMESFKRAMKMVGAEFVERITYYYLGWLPARSLVQQSVKNRADIHESREIIYLPKSGIPWGEHVVSLEEKLHVKPEIKYVLYQDATNNKWRIQCIPLRPDSFENRLSLPAEWCGLRDAELSDASGIPGCVFVHTNGFIGGNDTYEGVLKMASESLRLASKQN